MSWNQRPRTVLVSESGAPLGTSAFGEQLVVAPQALLDYNSGYGLDLRVFDTNEVGAGAVSNNLTNSAVDLDCSVANGDKAELRTNTWFRYQSGRGQDIVLTLFHSDAGVAGNVRWWGYWDGSDGLYWYLNEGTLEIRRDSTSGVGSVVVAQSAWNRDPMNGTGPSGVTLDLTSGNIYQITFQWLGVGTVEFRINGVLVHVMLHANLLPGVYMRTGSLPISVGSENTGASTASTMSLICAKAASQGGNEPPEYTFASGTAGTPRSISNSELPLVAVRLVASLNGAANRAIALPKSYTVTRLAAGVLTVRLRYVRGDWLDDVANAAAKAAIDAGTWSAVESGVSGMEQAFDIAAAGAVGDVLDPAYLNNEDTVTRDVRGLFGRLARHVQRQAFSGTSDVALITAIKSTAGGVNTEASLNWGEIR